MYKYIPKQSIIRDMIVLKTGNYWDKDYRKRQEILQLYNLQMTYLLTDILKTEYPNVCYYSKERRSTVPVSGYLFPVSMFEEIIL